MPSLGCLRLPGAVNAKCASARGHSALACRRHARHAPCQSAPPNASTASPTPSATSSPRPGRSRQTGSAVRYLNIGDPNQFGFSTPPHLIEAVRRRCATATTATRASPGIVEAREAVAADFAARGVNVSPDRVLITSGTSEGIELALTAHRRRRRSGAGAVADLSALHRGAREDRRRAGVLPHRSDERLAAGSRSHPHA